MTNDLKLKIYPAVIAILGFSLVALMLSRVQIQVAKEADIPVAPVPTSNAPTPTAPTNTAPTPTAPNQAPAKPETPSPSVAASPAIKPSPTSSPVPVKPAAVQGGLRVSNRTVYPMRLALLPLKSDAQTTAASSYSQPVHWDFAPEEGEAQGLILSLPSSNLRLQTGDVLVAFAQDGSRRYWGPYVVGKTSLPTWSDEQKEWLLILQP